MQKNYVEEHIEEYLKKTFAQIYPTASNTTLISLVLKRINSQLNFDPFFLEEFCKDEPAKAPIDNYLNSFVSNYLSPSLKSLSDPFLIKDMDKAVERITKALIEDENICIYGDYDVDGITSTSFLVSFLREIKNLMKAGGNDNAIFYKLPDRIKDGYGLGIEPINEIYDFINQKGGKPLSLLITVDLGITNVKEVSYANSKNIDVIICDHHEIPVKMQASKNNDKLLFKESAGGGVQEEETCFEEILPDAYAILNPKRKGDKFPFKLLPGVGIAFNLGIALRKRLVINGLINTRPDEVRAVLNLKDYLDIVCLGIIADIVPMYGDNRTLTYYGLKKINGSPRPGIKELKRICGLHFDNVNESDVAWKIAPKINASGRVSDPSIAVELLTQKDPEDVYRLAQELEAANRKRQALEDICFNEAISQINEKNLKEDGAPILILNGQSWHPGVIGIVSSKLVDYLQKPVLLLTGYKDSVYIGSARSCGNIDIYAFLKNYESFFAKFGGHKMACGLTIKKGQSFDGFMSCISKNAVRIPERGVNLNPDYLNNSATEGNKILDYDEEIDLNAVVKKDLTGLIKLMSPHGPLNEQPRFLIRDITLLNINKREFKNKNANSKKNGLFNCYFTLNIEGSSGNNNIKPKAFLFNKSKAFMGTFGKVMEGRSGKSGEYETTGSIFGDYNKDSDYKNKIPVNGIIFEFFNGYIKILNFI